MKLGIGTYTYPWAIGIPGHRPARPMTARELLARASELGVKVVQFCDNQPLTALPSDALEELAADACARGIQLELGTRGLEAANLLAYLALARRLAAPFVRLVIDAPGQEPTMEQALTRLRPVVAEYARANVKLALENHDRLSAGKLAGMVEALGPAHVGICLDTVNSFGALEGPAAVVATLAPYALNVHLKDFTIRRVSTQMGFEITGCAAGQGRLDVPWLLEQLEATPGEINAIVELWTPPAGTLAATIDREQAWAQASVHNLRQWIPV